MWVVLLQLFWIPAPFKDIGRCIFKKSPFLKLTLYYNNYYCPFYYSFRVIQSIMWNQAIIWRLRHGKTFSPGIREKVRSVRVRNVCSAGPFIVLLKISVELGQEHVSAITVWATNTSYHQSILKLIFLRVCRNYT